MAKKAKKNHIGDDYIKINKKINREIELERNGWHWISIDRPHKNKKKYNRKRDKVINKNDLVSFLFKINNITLQNLLCRP